MSSVISSHQLSPAEARQIDHTCDRFEAAWKAGQRPDPAVFLGDAIEPLRSALLHQLLLLDWEYRRLAADCPCAADYHTRFPGDTAVIVDVSRVMAAPPASSPAPSIGHHMPDHTAERDEQPPTSPDRYELVEEVGAGGIGVVYRSRDGLLGRELAVKVLRESFRDNSNVRHRFVEEARVGSQLQHPGIVPVYELGWFPDRRPFFTMRLVEGETLAALLRARLDPTRDLSRWLGVFGQVCQAVAYAHTRGIVHRDLKPANVMVGAFGEVQVVDWGFAKILGASEYVAENHVLKSEGNRPVDGSATVSRSGDLMGTPAYMPPEQARGETAMIDTRADVFALGAILCEVLTSRPPYVANTPHELCCRAAAGDLTDAYTRLDACEADEALRSLAKRCLAASRDDRPPNAGAVAREVSAYLTSVEERARRAELERAAAEVRAQEAVTKTRIERRARRLTVALAAAATVAMALGVGGWVWRDSVQQAEAARVAVADGKVEAALAETDGHLARKQWVHARAAAVRARELLQTGAGEARKASVEALLADIDLFIELDDLRVLRALYDSGGNRFREKVPLARYAEAFARYGLHTGMDPVEAGTRVAQRPATISETIVAGLEDWWLSARGRDPAVRDWLGRVLQSADGDEWRAQLRKAVMKGDRRLLEELGTKGDIATRPKATLTSLTRALIDAGAYDAAITLLRPAQLRYSDDFWINLDLADALRMRQPPNHRESLRFYSIAQALRTDISLHVNLGASLIAQQDWDGVIFVSRKALQGNIYRAEAHNNLGVGLEHKGEWEQAEAEYRTALKLDSKLAKAQFNLGKLFERRKQYDQAAIEYKLAVDLAPNDAESYYELANALYHRQEYDAALIAADKALELEPRSALGHAVRGEVLLEKGRLDDAIAAFDAALRLNLRMDITHSNLAKAWYLKSRQERNRGNAERSRIYLDRALIAGSRAVELDPESATNHYNLGSYRRASHDLSGAIASYEKAIQLDPNLAEVHCNLHQALQEVGRFAEALKEIEIGHRRGTAQANWPYPSDLWLEKARRLASLDATLPGILNGIEQPASVEEQLEYADVCNAKSLHAAATRLYADAFANHPALVETPEAGYGFQAACGAILAGNGRGQDAPSDVAERARLRKQALAWLRADLMIWVKRLSQSPGNASAIRGVLDGWYREPALAGLRELAALATLPEPERVACIRFWADVQVLQLRCPASTPKK